ncbi:GNAT family N-acetyltransferase [Spirosoma pollinicola]|uniref:GNAT family N-acetyltransferase n=1 Tax=Spirosoma pollinicola TaxID=2057025 RepID=A0A2K8ZAL6_9BACT|nr:N-acetyltransferase [Spirosoma pollinicola]AUD06917.1 GNAT family N-acetyltransferase [Spirosoma pollinicola]
MIDPLTIRIRPEQSADQPATEALALAAFDPDPRVAELVRRLRASDSLIPELNLVAQLEDTLVGHLMFSRTSITSGHQVAPLSPLGVLPTYQRQHIGSALMKHALNWLAASPYPVVVLEGVPSYYPRFGFVPAHDLGIDPPFNLPPAVWQAYCLPAYSSQVKGTVHYPEPFDLNLLHLTGDFF